MSSTEHCFENSKKHDKEKLKQTAKEILLSGAIHSQEELRECLLQRGFDLTQSKVSRLIYRLGALKTANSEGALIYTLPEIPPPPEIHSKISNLVVAIKKNEAMIVIVTNYGAANLVSRIIEHYDINREILGTIAGTDTIFIAPRSIHTLDSTYQEIQKILEREEN